MASPSLPLKALGWLVAVAVLAFSRDAIAATDACSNLDIIVIAGQSNAVGVSTGPFHDSEDIPGIDARVWQLGRIGADNGKIIRAVDPLQFWDAEPTPVTRGFGLPFGRRYVHDIAAAGRVTLLLPAAERATSILQWDPTGLAEAPTLYRDMLYRIGAMVKECPGSRVVAFHWQQGEQDIAIASQDGKASPSFYDRMPNASVYGQHLAQLIAALRTDLSDQGAFPIIVGEPTRAPVDPRYDAMRPSFVAEMKAVATHRHCVAWVASNGLASDSPAKGIHFSAEAEVQLGARRYATFAGMARHCLPAGDFRR